jgi:beta-glucosidase
VGLTDNSDIPVPVTETPADIEAARSWYIEKNLHLLDPIYRGAYSPAYLRRCGADRPIVHKGDFDLIGLPTDFLGLNIYTGYFVRAAKRRPSKAEEVAFPPDYPQSSCPWLKFMPQSIYWGTRLAHEVYGVNNLYITENGCGYDNEPLVNGEVQDLHRRDYVRNYLKELHRAIADGVPIKGYFLWSFMDNFEWQDGYARRFGMVHTDFLTQKRTPKLSAYWYATVMKENRVV